MNFNQILTNVFSALKTANIVTKSEYITEREAILIFAPHTPLKKAFDVVNGTGIETHTQRDQHATVLELYA